MIKKIMILAIFAFMGLFWVGAGLPNQNDTEHERIKKAVFRSKIFGTDRFPSDNPDARRIVDGFRGFIDDSLNSTGLKMFRWDRENRQLKSRERKLEEYEKTHKL